MVKEKWDYANTSPAEEFSAHCNDLLSDLAVMGNVLAEGISTDSESRDTETANQPPSWEASPWKA